MLERANIRRRGPKTIALIIAKVSLLVTWLAFGSLLHATEAKPPKLLASIRPIHGLLSALTAGVTEPVLLIQGQSSPHHYALRPSDKANLLSADAIFWIGPQLETFLSPILADPDLQTKALALDTSAGLIRLPQRGGKNWESHHDCGHGDHGHHHASDKVSGTEASTDPHIWLHPQNAIQMVKAMLVRLQHLDPAHQQQYASNAKALIQSIQQLDQDLKQQLSLVSDKAFLVFHDAYQYFEVAYGLKAVGAISLNPELPLSTGRLQAIEHLIETDKVVCLFSEPQFSAQWVSRLQDTHHLNTAMIDPLGQATSGENSYLVMMQHLGKTIQTCLQSDNIHPAPASPSHDKK